MNLESVHELMNIANCGIRKQYPVEIRYREVKPHWWSWKTVKEPYEYVPEPEYYRLEDSIKAIKELGESGDQHVLEFLEKLYTPEIDQQSERYFVSGGSEPRDDDWKYLITTSVVYPNAMGSLYDALQYIVDTTEIYEDDCGYEVSDVDYSAKLKRGELPPPENAEAHIVIQTAISKLKKVQVI